MNSNPESGKIKPGNDEPGDSRDYSLPHPVEIPLTGDGLGDNATGPPASPTPSPTQTHGAPPQGLDFIHEATAKLETCSESFRNYFILEQMVIENAGLFKNDAWRTDALSAMHLFENDCQTLGALPAAPPAYVEVEHWLKMAADEVKPATTSFTAAMDKEETGQFHVSIQHMLRFVDYIHNAESAMDGMLERKEMKIPIGTCASPIISVRGSRYIESCISVIFRYNRNR